ncbi:hypothetical protein FA13DRAFT_1856907 [Coprinellus micaceus]|uniref:CUE domain-containing protein n=1 Tax=Coprinellus micaceus TaxID=71717 RepID=A0A4Y7T9W0_COPMI|nr:hypothetical protein FA13DRAFT_1856907 [Coprinellus micaceus]
MSEPAKPTSPEPQTTGIASPEIASTAAPKSPSLPKSPFDESEAIVVQAAGSPSSPASTSPPSPFQDTQAPGDPRVAELRAMFPDLDDTILLMVLESVNGNQERAIETLLGMSDPDYKPETPAAAQAPSTPMTQEELDEQLARRLMIEEQEQQQARWYAQQQQRPRPQRQNSRPLEGQHQSPPPPPNGQGNDTMAEIQQSLTKAAEVGKRTIGDLFTKVKAKINEFEQGRQSGPQPQQQPQWAGGYDPPQGQYSAAGYAQYQHNHGSVPASGAPTSYYDPNAASPVISEQAVSPPSWTSGPAVEGYDVSSQR